MEEVTLTLAASITLYNTIGKILEFSENSEQKIPLNIKFKLMRSRGFLEKDYALYEQKRVNAVKKYGKEEEDGNIKVSDDKVDDFRKEILEIVKMEVSHSFDKISVKDMDYIKADNISAEELALLMAFIIDDPKLIEELSVPEEEN